MVSLTQEDYSLIQSALRTEEDKLGEIDCRGYAPLQEWVGGRLRAVRALRGKVGVACCPAPAMVPAPEEVAVEAPPVEETYADAPFPARRRRP